MSEGYVQDKADKYGFYGGSAHLAESGPIALHGAHKGHAKSRNRVCGDNSANSAQETHPRGQMQETACKTLRARLVKKR